MTPLLAAGAASVAGELVSRVAGALSSTIKPSSVGAHSVSKERGFDQTLHRVAGKGGELSQIEQLQQQVWQIPEVADAMVAQPVGAVTAAEVRADGTVALLTARGPLEVAVSAESRASLQRVYQGMVASGMSNREFFASAAGAVTSSPSSNGASRPASAPGLVIPVRGLK